MKNRFLNWLYLFYIQLQVKLLTFFFLFLPYQIIKPVTGKLAQSKLTIKAIILVGKPKIDPT